MIIVLYGENHIHIWRDIKTGDAPAPGASLLPTPNNAYNDICTVANVIKLQYI